MNAMTTVTNYYYRCSVQLYVRHGLLARAIYMSAGALLALLADRAVGCCCLQSHAICVRARTWVGVPPAWTRNTDVQPDTRAKRQLSQAPNYTRPTTRGGKDERGPGVSLPAMPPQSMKYTLHSTVQPYSERYSPYGRQPASQL